jgi:LysR family transcriptional regulator of gallate degradation
MSVNVRHLHAFHEVARLGSTSAAARSVHLTQPAITQAIARIERHFCARLFTRSSTGMQLTSAGEVCAGRISRALHALHDGIVELLGPAVRDPGALTRVAHGVRTAQLRALMAVAQHRNFTLAARASHVAQATVHRATRDLERLLKVPLFEKTSHGVVPTSGAEQLARRAGVAFAELEQAQAGVAALSGNERGRTVIGALPLAHSFLVPDVLVKFTRTHPEHRVAVIDGTYEQLVATLQMGQADLLIAPFRDSTLARDIVQEHLYDDPLSIIVRSDHPLAKRKRLSAADLSRYPWIAPRIGTPMRPYFDTLFQFAGIRVPERPVECNSLSTARDFLLASDRMMLLSANQVGHELKAGMLAAIPHPAGRVARPIGLTLRLDWYPTNAQAHLLEMLRQSPRMA